MTLEPGCRVGVAPHFHLPADWPRRLLIGAGVEDADGCFFPRLPWRPPTTSELAILTRPPAEPWLPESPESCVCLFQLPEHLRAEWWNLLEQAGGVSGDGRLPGFESFVNQVHEFLAFKTFPLPEGARCDVVVSDPVAVGRSVPWAAGASRPAGFLCSLAPWSPWSGVEAVTCPRLWGGINLGDEETSVVLINLTCPQMLAELQRRSPDQPAPTQVGELVWRFLHACPDYPPVRLILGPGEGYRLPAGGLILDRSLEDKQEPDVMLLISDGGSRSG